MSRADEPCGPEDGVCKIVSCMDKHYENGLCEMHYFKRKHAERVLDKYPEPLNWLVCEMVERNCREWLNGKPDTIGADEVRDTGLTSNQQRWVSEIAERLKEGGGRE